MTTDETDYTSIKNTTFQNVFFLLEIAYKSSQEYKHATFRLFILTCIVSIY
jgi:hypothetical protein